jgi:hypothetical protein
MAPMTNKNDAPGSKPAPRRRRAQGADAISAGLRQLWAEVEQEPVPDEFLDLLDRIDAARRRAG